MRLATRSCLAASTTSEREEAQVQKANEGVFAHYCFRKMLIVAEFPR